MTDITPQAERQRELRARLSVYSKFDSLARGPYLEPVLDVMSAYLAAAIDDPVATAGEYWALSCLPGTTKQRVSALTMRITDILVVNRVDHRAEALVIVERSSVETAFASHSDLNQEFPELRFEESSYHGAGLDQLKISGSARRLARCLDDPRIGEPARAMARHMMTSGRAMHWRGHSPVLADLVLEQADARRLGRG